MQTGAGLVSKCNKPLIKRMADQHDILFIYSFTTYATDPMPSFLFKSYLDVMLTTVTGIVIVSLECGLFPSDMKSARLGPLLKQRCKQPCWCCLGVIHFFLYIYQVKRPRKACCIKRHMNVLFLLLIIIIICINIIL